MSASSDGSSIGSVELGGNDTQWADENEEASLMPYGHQAAGIVQIPEQLVRLQNEQHPEVLACAPSISLSRCLTVEQAKIIANRLRTDKTLRSLRVDECHNCEGTNIVVDAVGCSPYLQSLELIDSYTVDECAVTQALKNNTSLRELELSFMYDLTAQVGEFLSKNTLESLAMLECDLDPHWETRLVHGLKHNSSLQSLTLRNPSYLSNDDIISEVIQSSSLKVLNLSGFDFPGVIQQQLGDLLSVHTASLESLVLKNNGITEAGVLSLSRTLPKFQQLKHLDLSSHRLIDWGVCIHQFVRNLPPSLEKIDLNHVRMTDGGLRELRTLPSGVRSLSVWESVSSCRYTNAGIEALVNAMPTLPSLTDLGLMTSNPIQDRIIGFWHRYNRAQVQRLLSHEGNVPSGMWPEILFHKQRYGSDVLYMMVKELPCLFCPW